MTIQDPQIDGRFRLATRASVQAALRRLIHNSFGPGEFSVWGFVQYERLCEDACLMGAEMYYE